MVSGRKRVSEIIPKRRPRRVRHEAGWREHFMVQILKGQEEPAAPRLKRAAVFRRVRRYRAIRSQPVLRDGEEQASAEDIGHPSPSIASSPIGRSGRLFSQSAEAGHFLHRIRQASSGTDPAPSDGAEEEFSEAALSRNDCPDRPIRPRSARRKLGETDHT
jgi:hypothetical protein